MKIKGKADYGIVGGKREIVFEIEDDATEKEINEWIWKISELVWEQASEYIPIAWEKIK